MSGQTRKIKAAARRAPQLNPECLVFWAEGCARELGVRASAATQIIGRLMAEFGGRRIPKVSPRIERDMEIISTLNSGEEVKDVAVRYEVSERTVRRIAKRPFIEIRRSEDVPASPA